VLLLDVTPLTLSIETLGGVSTPLIERNTTIPTKRSQVFSTAADGQTQVEIHVLQGERPMASDNKSLGKFILDGIPPAPRGVPQIEVTFDIDANGILNVNARDKATGREQAMQIMPSSGLKDTEIDRMVHEAEEHAAEDARVKERIESHNQLDNAIYAAEKFIKDNGDKLPDATKSTIEDEVAKAREALQSDDLDRMQSGHSALQAVIQQAGAAMYEQQAQAGQTPPEDGAAGSNGAGDEDVIEGEFSEG
jgi:molecular chaperone DnaK